MKIEKLKRKIVDQMLETEIFSPREIKAFKSEIDKCITVHDFIDVFISYGFRSIEASEILFKILVKVPEPSPEEKPSGAPKAEDWEEFLKTLRKKFGNKISWYNDKRKYGRRIKIVGVRDDVFRKQVYDFIHKLGYDVHEHITEHTVYPKTLVVYFK